MTDQKSNPKKFNENGNGRKNHDLEGMYSEGNLSEKIVSDLKITKIQDLQLQIIALTSHNNFDGKKINKLLLTYRHLWRAVMMPPIELFPLRDMEEGLWVADTLYLIPQEGKEFELEDMVREQFNADEITWIGSDQALDLLGYWNKDAVLNPKLILSVWWD
jgi:hypothetical protein